MTPRISYPGACVLQALFKGSRYGFDIMDFTGLPSGTVYPLLRRFEDHGLVRFYLPEQARWSSIANQRAGLGELVTDAVRAAARDSYK